MNKDLLRSVMIKNGDTMAKLAEAMGLPISALSQRINGHIEFRRNEILFIKYRYNLTSEEVDMIFFRELVSA